MQTTVQLIKYFQCNHCHAIIIRCSICQRTFTREENIICEEEPDYHICFQHEGKR